MRRAGVALTLGACTSAVGVSIAGFRPETQTGILTNDLTGAVFQLGLLALVHVHATTGSIGGRRHHRVLIEVERVLIVLAIVWTLSHAFLPGQRDSTWMAALDFTWPLSMLGLFLIGLTIAIKGTWRGPARAWALVAETWVVVTLPALGILGESAGTAVGVAHLVLGYVVLGVLLVRRPDLVTADEERSTA